MWARTLGRSSNGWMMNDVTPFFLFFVLLTKMCVVIVKASSGPRYVVGCRNKVNKDALKAGSIQANFPIVSSLIFFKGTRVALDVTTFTIMRILPREVDPLVFSMLNQESSSVFFHARMYQWHKSCAFWCVLLFGWAFVAHLQWHRWPQRAN